MEYELYIANRLADLDDKIKIALNYTAIDTDSPVSEHGSFSKSVELPGTANNNEIFGQMYDVSRAILGDDPEAGGVYFDPRKRTPYVLYYNGDVNDRGYIKVDSISNTDGDISYSCTLYSDLGDFFYNLCYNEDGEELNLGDLHYGFTDYSGNTIDEDGILCKWDKDYISGGWDKIRNVFNDPTDRTVNNFLVAAPTYGGYYDDFDNDKVLVNYSSIASGSTAYRLLQPVINADSAYTPYKGWILCEATRDLDEWEARDLRSTYQRPAVKMSLILDAISDPENNGGYEVIWDDSIKNSPYYTHTFLLMNRLNFDNDPQANGLLQLNGDASMRVTSTPWNKWYEMTMSTTSGSTLDLSGYKEPRMTMSLNNAFSATVAREGQTIYTSYFTKYYPIYTEDYYKTAYVYGGMVVRADVYVNGSLYSSTPNYLISTDVYNSKKGFGYEVDDWKQQIGTQLGIDPDTIVLKFNNLSWNNGDVVWDKDIRFALDLPNVSGVQVKFNVAWSWARSKSNVSACAAFQSDDRVKGWLTGTILGSTMLFNYENGDGYDTGIFDGTINPALQKSNVTKRVLFSETETPYKYLVGFTRMLGAKYKYDLGAKKIYIMPRNKYYLPYGHMIDEWIDRGQKMEVQPTLSEYKWYNYGFETPETYAAQLYNRRNKTEYGVKKVDTGYYFNNDTNNLFEDIPYTNGIPYLQQSIYYNVAVGVPQILLSPTFKGTVFCESGGTIETKETTAYGYSSSHSLSVRKDMSGDKICCFDDGNDPVEDVTNCLVFYVGFADIGNTYQISDNLPIMGTLNENPCFMALTGYTAIADADSDTPVEVKKEVIGVPRFSKYLRNLDNVYVDSLDFMKPAYTFIDNYDNYQDGICIYDRYWRAFIEDLYERNAKAVTVKMFLKEKPDVAMRKFYFFDNSIWVISEITDYDASSDEPTQVKFVKVYDTSDYTDGEIAWDDYYRVPGTIDPDSGGGSGGDEPSATTYEYRWVQDSSSGCSGYTQCYYYKKQQRPSGTSQAWVDCNPPVISMNGDGTMQPIVIAYSSVTCGYGACNCVDKNIRLWGKNWDGDEYYYSGGTIPPTLFDEMGDIINIEICGGITAIEYDNFIELDSDHPLESVVIGAGVTSIGNNCFNGNSYLERIICLAMTAPSLGTHVFSDLETRWGTRYFASAGTLYYPQGATGYDVWLNRLPSGWTGVEMSGATYEYEWFVNDNLSGCSGTTKYKLYQKYERNVACGSPQWAAVVPTVTSIDADGTKQPIVLETGSTDCGYVPPYEYRWVQDSSSGCSGYTQCQYYKKQQRISGSTDPWVDVNPPVLSFDGDGTMQPIVIAYSSTTCGYVPPTPTCSGRAVVVHLTGGTEQTYSYSNGIIPSQAFNARTDFESATICDGITKIGSESFRDCWRMTAVTIPSSVTTIGNSAFTNCQSLTSVTIPDSVTSIGTYAFSECYNMTSATISSGVTIIDSTFYNCSKLTSVTIPQSVTVIGTNAFAYCESLTSITIPSSVRTIGSASFRKCMSLRSVSIPSSVTVIGSWAFDGCSGMTSVTIPSSVTYIYEGAFCDCKSLLSVSIPSPVPTIEYRTFKGCRSLTSVTIPSSVTKVWSGAFSGCTSLTSITCYATTAPSLNTNYNDIFDGLPTSGTLYVPSGATGYDTWLNALPSGGVFDPGRWSIRRI